MFTWRMVCQASNVIKVYNSQNFLVVGVATDEMRYQLEQMHVEKFFDLSEILYLDDKWQQFVNEVFHHTLRLLERPFQIG